MPTLNHHQLKTMIVSNDPIELIDVRSKADYDEHHIEGAANIDVREADFVERVKSKIEGPDDKVVIYGAGEEDAGAVQKAIGKLAEADLTKVYLYEGGLEDWDSYEEETVRSNG